LISRLSSITALIWIIGSGFISRLGSRTAGNSLIVITVVVLISRLGSRTAGGCIVTPSGWISTASRRRLRCLCLSDIRQCASVIIFYSLKSAMEGASVECKGFNNCCTISCGGVLVANEIMEMI